MRAEIFSTHLYSKLFINFVFLGLALAVFLFANQANAQAINSNFTAVGTPALRPNISVPEMQALLSSISARLSENLQVRPIITNVAGTSSVAGVCPFNWTRNLNVGSQGADVKRLQQFLNSDSATSINAAFGSAGNETEYFGLATGAAVVKFQEKYSATVLAPAGLSQGSGFVGESTRRQLNELCTGSIVTPAPIVTGSENFTATPRTGNSPLSVLFKARTVGNNVSDYTIDFGDGNEGSLQHDDTVVPGQVGRANMLATYTYNTAGTYRAKLMVNRPCPSGQSCTQALDTVGQITITVRDNNIQISNPPEVPTSQEVLFNQNNIYSPTPVMVGNATHLYFGGWLNNGQVNDNIYRAVCNSSGKSCGSIRTVIDAAALGFEHLNDPSVVRIKGNSSNGGRDYLIMYMTGVLEGEDGFVPTNNDIYFATSWADDGINWSVPKKVLENHWLPSATLNSAGEVELFANDNGIHGNVTRLNLGKSGIDLKSTTRVDYGKANGTDTLYSNPYVQYMPSSKQYYILAERMNAPSAIDAFVSSNGVDWTLTAGRIISVDQGQARVGSPAFHPNNPRLIYFASTAEGNSMGYKIRFAEPMDNPFAN